MSGITRHGMEIGDCVIGDGQPVFVIAEIGYNFNSPAEARASIDAAADSGVDAVKFQTFTAETITSRLTEFPPEAGGRSQFEEFKEYEMSRELHEELFAYAGSKDLLVFSTPSHSSDVEMLEELGVVAHKVGSDDLTNLPFLQHVARTGKPMIISTGMAAFSEVAEAFETIRSTGHNDFAILQCVSNYPIRDLKNVNLRVIETYRQAFDVPIGFSDHTEGVSAALGAVALGASIVEKHFTIDKKLDVPDAFFSADPQEMTLLVRLVRELEQELGSRIKEPTAAEREMRQETRKSLIAARNIPADKELDEDDVIVKRPGTGIPPKLAHLALGRRTKQDIAADEVVTWQRLH